MLASVIVLHEIKRSLLTLLHVRNKVGVLHLSVYSVIMKFRQVLSVRFKFLLARFAYSGMLLVDSNGVGGHFLVFKVVD